MPDDWELEDWGPDDWDDEAVDEDGWDTTELGLEGDDWFDVAQDDAGDLGDEGVAPAVARAGAVTWSAWEVGTVFALGGWLADRHAEEVGRQVQAALRGPSAAGRTGERAARGAPYPPPSSGYPYGRVSGTLRVGEPLDRGRLYADLAAANARGRDWLVQAEARPGVGRELVLVVSAAPLSTGPRLWVVAEESTGGFAATRLVPVFQPERQGGLAVFATDEPHEAADAAAWAATREGVDLDAFTVTETR